MFRVYQILKEKIPKAVVYFDYRNYRPNHIHCKGVEGKEQCLYDEGVFHWFVAVLFYSLLDKISCLLLWEVNMAGKQRLTSVTLSS